MPPKKTKSQRTTDQYENYFTDRYGYDFTPNNLTAYQNWFDAQWQEVKTLLEPDDTVLEIGSAMGALYELIQAEYPSINYLGIELDADAVAFANEYYKTDAFSQTLFEDFTPSRKYSKIMAFEVLEHVENPKEFIKKIQTLLENGGAFIGTSPFPFHHNVLDDVTHNYVLHPESWKRLFRQAGFSNVSTRPFTFIPGLWNIHKKFNPIIPIYIPLPKLVSTTFIYAKK